MKGSFKKTLISKSNSTSMEKLYPVDLKKLLDHHHEHSKNQIKLRKNETKKLFNIYNKLHNNSEFTCQNNIRKRVDSTIIPLQISPSMSLFQTHSLLDDNKLNKLPVISNFMLPKRQKPIKEFQDSYLELLQNKKREKGPVVPKEVNLKTPRKPITIQNGGFRETLKSLGYEKIANEIEKYSSESIQNIIEQKILKIKNKQSIFRRDNIISRPDHQIVLNEKDEIKKLLNYLQFSKKKEFSFVENKRVEMTIIHNANFLEILKDEGLQYKINNENWEKYNLNSDDII